MSKCDFQIPTSSRVYPKFMESVFREPGAYIAKQIDTICQCETGSSLIQGIYEKIGADKKIQFIFSETESMSGDVKDGNGIVVINFDKCVIDWNSEMEFPEIYSLIPLIQGQLELPTAGGKMLVVEIAPDRSPFWMSIAHELIHVFHKLTDPEAYEKRIKSTPQEVIESISKNQTLYPSFFELRVPRLSQALWTNEEERETVIGIGISEFTIRREMKQKIRYIYQASDKVFLELKETVDRVNGSPLPLPSIPLSFDCKFDLALTPLNILGKIFEKQQLVNFLLDENSYIGHNIGNIAKVRFVTGYSGRNSADAY